MNLADSARVEYETAIRMEPKYVEALTGLGNLLRKQEKTAAGNEKLELAVKYDAKDPAALYSLGTAYLRDKEYDKAEKIFRRGTLLKTGRAQFLAGTALALEGKGQLKEAEELFIRARRHPNNLRVRLDLGAFRAKKIPSSPFPNTAGQGWSQDPSTTTLRARLRRHAEYNGGLRSFVRQNLDSSYAPAISGGSLFYARRLPEVAARNHVVHAARPRDRRVAGSVAALSYSSHPPSAPRDRRVRRRG